MGQSNEKSPLMCPNCESTFLSANKKGFNGTKAGLGMLVAGPLGLTIGMKGMNDIEITCLQCGNTFKPGEGATSKEEIQQKRQVILDRKESEKTSKTIRYTIAIVLIIIICIVFYNYFSFLF